MANSLWQMEGDYRIRYLRLAICDKPEGLNGIPSLASPLFHGTGTSGWVQ
jgi:hypothetical protein